jgi:hypothetical protein
MDSKFKILDVKKTKKSKQYDLPPQMLQPPYSLLLIAPTRSGKSICVTNLLKNKNMGYSKGVFEEVYFISPTVMIDDSLNSIADDDEIIKISEPEELEHVDEILDEIVKKQKELIKQDKDSAPQILIILDDMIEYFKRNSKIDVLPSLSRHYNITFWICSQSFAGTIPTKLRKNCTAYLIFKLYNKKDLQAIDYEIGSNYPDFMKYYNECTKENFNFMYLNNRSMTIYKNFTDELWDKVKDNDKNNDKE